MLSAPAQRDHDRDDRLPLVHFVPFRCPNCQRHKPRSYGQQGRIRWHVCQACGQRYKSIEVATLEEAAAVVASAAAPSPSERKADPDQASAGKPRPAAASTRPTPAPVANQRLDELAALVQARIRSATAPPNAGASKVGRHDRPAVGAEAGVQGVGDGEAAN